MAKITNLRLVEACLDMAGAANPVEKTWTSGITAHKDRYGYVYGAKGEMCTQALLEKFAKSRPGGYEPSYFLVRCKPWIGRRVTDCSGMITLAIRTADPSYKGTNSTNYYNGSTKKGAISAIPEVPGLCVWRSGHIGTYLGGGMVVESRGADYGVVISTIVSQSPKWTNWGYLKDVDYSVGAPEESRGEEVLILGEKVNVRDRPDTNGHLVSIARKGEIYPLVATASTGWYKIGEGRYISNRADLTKLI